MKTSTEIHANDPAERRGTGRFPLQEEVRYRIIHAQSKKASGAGVTLNMGSRGILFTTEEQLPIGDLVELSVNWPARLGGTCPLQFIATGRIVRSEPGKAAARIERYEFRTRRLSALSAVAGLSSTAHVPPRATMTV